MNSCYFVNFISILACDISKNKSSEELAILSTFLTQLGDTLATIATLNND